MNILHYIALIMTAVNVIRKVIAKRNLIGTLYSKSWCGVSGRLIKQYKIRGEDCVVGLKVYSNINGKITTSSTFFTWWTVKIPYSVPNGLYSYGVILETWGNNNIICGRLGQNVQVEFFSQVPKYAVEIVKKSRRGKYETHRIKPEYSILKFAKSHGMTESYVYSVIREFAVGSYRKMQMDGLYPPEVFL
jgi:hypothetical protein